MHWSFQLYSARNFKPWDKVVESLARLGYTQVEGFGGVYDDPPALRRLLDANGLSMPSGHFSVDMLEKDFDGARRIADALGATLLVAPYLPPDQRPEDRAGWTAFGERLAGIGDKARAAGYGFAWHNHDFEFRPLADGSIPQKTILDTAPEIGLELDVAWVIRGGADPERWIDEYGDRIVAVHVKDIAAVGTNAGEDGWADVGDGTVDWKRLVATLKAKTPATIFAMEHDNPSDFQRFAERSLVAARSYEGA